MEYVALYRKYRPKKLEEIYGQKYIVNIIKNSITNNRFMHAYLFSGPRGTGKTTIAKLLAKIMNCSNLNGFDPCDECESCKMINEKNNPDIVEIDAASNNGVDEIRSVRDSVVLMPSISKYKVYIIDEVHMLSTSAFNALLKTLEEPPKHVVFILATTEINKVPETIVSRCQCYDFKRIGIDDIVNCLTNICEKECLNVDKNVLTLIAEHSNGGMRDSIGLLDKLLSYSDVINKDLFYDVVGLIETDMIANLFNNIYIGSVQDVFDSVEKLVNNGKSIELITEQLLNYLKGLIVNKPKIDISYDILMNIFNCVSNIFVGLKDTYNQLLFFEVEILKVMNLQTSGRLLKETTSDNVLDAEFKNDDVYEYSTNSDGDKDDMNDNKIDKQTFVKNANEFDIIINNAFALADKKLKVEIVNKWNLFNDYVHNKEFSSLVSFFLDANVEVAGKNDVIISVDNDTVVDNANKVIVKLELLFNLVMGKTYNLVFVTKEKWNNMKEEYISKVKNGKIYEYIDASKKNDDIINIDATSDLTDVAKTARSIFGKELVEVE